MTADKPRPARISVRSPPKLWPTTAGLRSILRITASKWSAICPTDFRAKTSGWAFACSTVSGSSGQPGRNARVARAVSNNFAHRSQLLGSNHNPCTNTTGCLPELLARSTCFNSSFVTVRSSTGAVSSPRLLRHWVSSLVVGPGSAIHSPPTFASKGRHRLARRMDWGDGGYEHISDEMLPAAEVVVDAAALRCRASASSISDAATATRRCSPRQPGAQVTGIDPAPRLLEVAAARAAERSLDVSFRRRCGGCDAAVPMRAADVILSVFAVVFAPDAVAAAREMARVAAPRSRMVLSAWRPHGAIAEAVRMRSEAMVRANGAQPTADPPPFDGTKRGAAGVVRSVRLHRVRRRRRTSPFSAPSAASFANDQFRDHPGWIEAARVLDGAALAALRDRAVGACTRPATKTRAASG